MSQWRNEVLVIISSTKSISFCNWNELINFYNVHKDELDEKECRMVLDKSEEYRLYLNSHSCSYIERHEVKI